MSRSEAGRSERSRFARARFARPRFAYTGFDHPHSEFGRSVRNGSNAPSLSILVLIAPLLALTSGCVSVTHLQNRTPIDVIAIDGVVDDWGSALQPIEKEPFSLGVFDDGEFLYVALVSSDPAATGQIMRRGLTLWADPEGGRDKVLGIRFPVGLMDADVRTGPRGRTHRGGGGTDGRPGAVERGSGERGRDATTGRDSEWMEEQFRASLSELEILMGDQDAGRRHGVGSVPGISARATMEHGTFVYEVRLPLQSSATYRHAAEGVPGTAIGLGLETPELDARAMQQMVREGGRDGGRGGVGVPPGMGGMGGGMPDQGLRLVPDRLSFWATFTLSGSKAAK